MRYHDSVPLWKDLLYKGLSDDDWQWDWTTQSCLKKPDQKTWAKVVAKSAGIFAGEGLSLALELLCEELGAPLEVKSKFSDGDKFKVGDTLVEWSGPARIVLGLERTYLNLLSYVCGIATRTRIIVGIVEEACPDRTPRVAATRKTLPGYRDVAVSGVVAGGGHSHRVSLAAGVLIKENHIAAAGGIAAALERARKVAPHGLKIEIEVRDEKELKLALENGADAVLLDNFSPAQVKSALKLIDTVSPRPVVEVSGGLSEKNIAEYALPGVDVLSVGSLTHSVPVADLSMLVQGT